MFSSYLKQMSNAAHFVRCKNQAGFTENSLGFARIEFLEQLVLVQRSVPEANSIDLNHY